MQMPIRTLIPVLLLAVLSGPATAAPAYLHAKGVFKIDDAGKVTRVVADGDLPMIMAVDNDGDVWVSSVGGKLTAYKARKRTVQLPSKSDTGRAPVAMIAAADGGVWALGREHLFRVTAAGKLQKHALFVPRLLGPASILESGKEVWVASENGLHRFTGGTWEAPRPGAHEHLVRDSSGVMWSSMRSKDKPDVLVGYDGTKWFEVPIDGDGVSGLAAGKDGRVYAVVWRKAGKSRVDVMVAPGGAAKWTKKLGEIEDVRWIVVDADERIWLDHAHALVVLAKDGKRIARLEPGAIAGVVGNPTEVVVAGAGPRALPSAATVATGTVTGRIMKSEKEPLANAKLQVCVGDCTGSAPKFEIATDASGKFTASNVAAVEYSSIRTNTTVHSIGNFFAKKQLACCLAIVAGKTLDLGTIRAPANP
jgi:streptogramin lyase